MFHLLKFAVLRHVLRNFILILYIMFYQMSVCPSFRPSKIFFVAFFSVTVDGRNLIFCHKRHIGIPYCGQRFWTHQIPTYCLPTQSVFIHIEHICTFFVTFFSATIDGRYLIFGHKLYIGTSYHGKRFWTIRFLLPKDWEGHVPCTIGASKSIVAH